MVFQRAFPGVLAALLCLFAPGSRGEEATIIGTGTGWVLAPNFVVTNYHVVKDADAVVLIRTDDKQLEADVVVRDQVNDLVLLRPREPDLLPPGLPLAPAAANVGASVFTIGYPWLDIMGREPKMTTGYVSARTGIGGDPRTYQISIPIQPGNSGGPVLNMNGEVVGVATGVLDAAKVFQWKGALPQNVNYAVKTNYVRALRDAAPPMNRTVAEVTGGGADLEHLVQRVQASVMIVVSLQGGARLPGSEQASASVRESPSPMPRPSAGAKRVALFVFTRPSGYDRHEGFDDDTVEKYSNRVAKLVLQMIEENTNWVVKEKRLAGAARGPAWESYKHDARPGMCKRYDVDFLLTVMNDSTTGGGVQEISYFGYDCKAGETFDVTKRIERRVDEAFGYARDLRRHFETFLDRLPRKYWARSG